MSSTDPNAGKKLPVTTATLPTVPVSTVVPTTATAPAAAPDPLSFSQFENCINKWSAELCEDEAVFLNQATQINAWDKAINANEERLITLDTSIKQVQEQQTRINYDLDFIQTQLKELEDCIEPLEKEMAKKDTTNSEPQRRQLYKTAQDVDIQMKRLSEDLKEVIEHINDGSRGQVDTMDPVLQVGRVLNAHVESLQSIDDFASRVQESLDTLVKAHQTSKDKTDKILPRDS